MICLYIGTLKLVIAMASLPDGSVYVVDGG